MKCIVRSRTKAEANYADGNARAGTKMSKLLLGLENRRKPSHSRPVSRMESLHSLKGDLQGLCRLAVTGKLAADFLVHEKTKTARDIDRIDYHPKGGRKGP